MLSQESLELTGSIRKWCHSTHTSIAIMWGRSQMHIISLPSPASTPVETAHANTSGEVHSIPRHGCQEGYAMSSLAHAAASGLPSNVCG